MAPIPIRKWIAAEQLARDAEKRAAKLLRVANNCPRPKRLREAKASDIREGAIIWYKHGGDNDAGFWMMVAEPLHYGDPFKAYVAHDGCRYGLDDAWVQIGA